MNTTVAFISGILIFSVAAGMVASTSVPLGWTFVVCALVCAFCAVLTYLNGE